MFTFVVLAALALVLAVAVVAIPLVKPAPAGDPNAAPPAHAAALAAVAVLLLGSAISYGALSNWRWATAAPPDSPQTMVARLARRLEQTPDDQQGWVLLGRSYAQLEQYGLAARSYERANRLANGHDEQALTGEAEALILNDETTLTGRAGKLLEDALALDPDSGKALFYGANAAAQRGELKLARDRFAKLLTMSPPDNVKQFLQQQIAALDQRLAGGGAAAPFAQAGAAQAGGAQPAASGGPAAAGGPAVRVTLELPKGAKAPDPGTRLFVMVRDPAQPGPPLAAKLLQSRFPQTVELTPQDSPMGRGFAAGQQVQVVARISLSGNPIGGKGDPFGEVAYRVGKDGLVNITINQVTP